MVRRSLSCDKDISDLYEIAKKVGKEYKSLVENGAGRHQQRITDCIAV